MKRQTALDYLEALADRTPEDLDLPAYAAGDDDEPRGALRANEPTATWPVALTFED